MRVLIIDDSQPDSYYLTRKLLKLGIAPEVAIDVMGAFEEMGKGDPFDLIFLDYHLTGRLDGKEFLAIKKAIGLKIPVIVLSGRNDVHCMTECFKAGADAFLVKPVQDSLLMEQLNKLGVKV